MIRLIVTSDSAIVHEEQRLDSEQTVNDKINYTNNDLLKSHHINCSFVTLSLRVVRLQFMQRLCSVSCT